MRFVVSAVAVGSLFVVFACGGDDPASGPPAADDGGSPDGTTNDGGPNADGSVDPNACPGDACGGRCGPCRAGKACKIDADCASNFCENDLCVQTAGCYPSGFCWENPSPTGAALRAIRGTGPNDVWAVGDQSYVMHWDGKRWRAVSSGIDLQLSAVAFADATHGWAVSGKDSVLFYDGTKWTKQTGITSPILNDVFAIATNDVWAVGDYGAVWHWDGNQWTSATMGGLGRLYAVWAANKDDVWIAGDNGQIWKWAGGATWNAETIDGGATPEFRALGGASASTVFAGTYGAAIYGRSGTTWSVVKTLSSPNPGYVEDIFTLDGTHAYLAGIEVFERWNGATWNTESVTAKTGRGFFGAWASSPNDVWLAGELGELIHHDGAAWKDFGERFVLTTNDAFSGTGLGITAIDAKSVIIVGEDGQVVRKNGVTGKWTKEVIPDGGDKRAVSANGPSDIVAVGSDIHRWDGATWKKEEVSDGSGWYAITRVTPTTPWIAGNDGLVAKWTGMGWAVDETTGTTSPLRGIWAADPMNVWAVGVAGVIIHWNGVAWEKETSPAPSADILAVWGSSAADVWAAGNGKILHRVNGAWKIEEGSAAGGYRSIAGNGPNDVWFSGQSPTGIVHWDGAQFTVSHHNWATGTLAIAGSSMYLASSNGYVLKKD